MLPVDVLYATQIEGGVEALREYDDTNFLKPNGQSRNLNIYDNNCEVHLLTYASNPFKTINQ